jgi:adenylate kinase family enzyme
MTGLKGVPRTDQSLSVQRVSVVGVSGSGKTTFGRRLSTLLDAPFVELDGIFHQPGWTELPTEAFRARVSDVVAGDRWIVDGNYSAVRDLVWARADTVFALDLGRAVVMRRVITRTVRRALTREELWNGNREPLANFYRWDPTKSIIRWSWVNHATYAARYRDRAADPQYGHIEFIRFGSPREVDAWLAAAGGSRGSAQS